ncbi:hypothetical protein F5Y14DRAFT_154537 [Nemania sp. NC0429]|nr:hypothetical protein F5Y14DRAFT_154537 [Nemania sp. NC0429]
MGVRATPALPKRTGSWDSDMTYHSLYEDDDDKKTFFVAESGVGDLEGSREKPKIALTKRFSWLHPLVHLLPVGVTLGILQLSLRWVYLDDDTRYDTRWQAVLQFPAKVHEILVVGSLSAMVLHIFRRMLVNSKGIPLGLMVGAFQIGSAEYLISKSFVKPLRHSLMHGQYKTFLVAVALGLAILFSFLVGPASAGALIPVLAWWDMPRPFNDSLPLTSYIGRSTSELYPLTLQRSSINPDCLGDDWDYQGCPAEGYNVLVDWAWTRVKERYRYNVTEGQHYNPVMLSSFSGQVQREIVTELMAAKNSSTAAAITATLHSSALALTDALWHYISSNVVGKINKVKHPKLIVSRDTPVSIPLVQVQCVSYDYGKARSGNPPLTFETSAMVDDFSNSGSNTYSWMDWVVPDAEWNFTRPLNITKVRWVDAASIKGTQGDPLHASLAAIVTVPKSYQFTLASGPKIPDQRSFTSPCIIDARWATTDVTFDTTDVVVGTSLTDWLNSANLLTGDVDVRAKLSKWKISDPIAISPDWAATLNTVNITTPAADQGIYLGLDFVERLIQEFVNVREQDDGTVNLDFYPSSGQTTPADIANDLAIILSTTIADWLSRSTFRDTNFTTVLSAPAGPDGAVSTVDLLIQRSPNAFRTAQPAALLAADQTPVVFRVQRYGWGYGLNTDTIWFSVVILLMHAFLVAVYFAYSFVFWLRAKGWTSNAWGTIGEFVALAVVSPPADELRNSGAGIHHSRTWMTELRIREAGADPERLELVVGRRHGMVVPTDNMVRIDKAYA